MKARLALLWLVIAAGCASVPDQSVNQLESARAAYRAAAADPQVQARARIELDMAERALGDAERLHGANVDPGRVAHFAYLAERRARIAQKTAELRAAEAALATGGGATSGTTR